jgi:hypothetical protein
MKPIIKSAIIAVFLATSATVITSGTVNAAGFDRANSKYCRNNTFDPLCMDEKMMDMRSKIMKMDQKAMMENRSKYCENNASDSACAPDVMKSEARVAGFDSTHSKYCEMNSFDTLCMDDKMMEMRTKMMSMDKKAMMDNRSKFCDENASDSACQPDVMNNDQGL